MIWPLSGQTRLVLLRNDQKKIINQQNRNTISTIYIFAKTRFFWGTLYIFSKDMILSICHRHHMVIIIWSYMRTILWYIYIYIFRYLFILLVTFSQILCHRIVVISIPLPFHFSCNFFTNFVSQDFRHIYSATFSFFL